MAKTETLKKIGKKVTRQVSKVEKKVNTRKGVRRFWIIFFSPVALLLLLLLLTATGLFGRLPSFDDLENPKSNLATEIYAEDGQMIGSYFLQNRSYTSYDELAPSLVAALVATEDTRFYSHSGIDFLGLTRVALKTVILGQDQGGGSTISQQLAKNLYKTRESTVRPSGLLKYPTLIIFKLKDWITAVMLEYNYTKEEIIAMYLNTVEYGSNAFGIKSAARTFFNTTPDKLTPEQSAMLVAVVNAPTKYSPTRNPENAIARRNLVLSRMQSKGMISRVELDSLKILPIELDFRPVSHNEGAATYFREMLRLMMTADRPSRSGFANDWDYEQELRQWEANPLYGWCHKNRRSDGSEYNLYRDGLKIYTTINSRMQRYAEESLVEQLKNDVQPALDAQIRRTGRIFNNINKQEEADIILRSMKQTDRYRAYRGQKSDEEILKMFDEPTQMTVFSHKGDIDTMMTPCDSILYYKRLMRASFMAMEPGTGYVKAYVGGPSFKYFKYDMVKQGKRQIGSTVKPFVYTFGIDHLGLSPCTLVPNLPTTIETYNGMPWQPKEAGNIVYDGVLHPLWWGLANSRNNYSAWVMKQSQRPEPVADFIHRLGIHSYIDPVYALCLGTSDASLFEMVGAYGTYANRGVHVEPMFVVRVEDRQGNVISTFTPKTSDAISEQTAYTMIQMMKLVVNAGTGGRLSWGYGVRGEVGGKTGTSQGNADAWFMGVVPKLVGGAWVGGEDRSVHLTSGGEGSARALPVFGGFMQKVYADKSLGINPEDAFSFSPGMVGFDCAKVGYDPAQLPIDDEFFH
ncbi:MAG: transglycosylase domain-containing protein [Rikenellaceae bacterium]|jgi:penicillin-binding protein 1A|nr:transglycosylase domain-containing protein [Rikenellaceae bacterium]